MGNVEPIKLSEQVGAVYDHMKYTGKYLEDGFNLVLSEVASRCVRRRDRQLLLEGRVDGEGGEDLEELDFAEEVASSLDHGTTKKLNEILKLLQKKEINPGIFEMSVEIVKEVTDSPTLFILTTLDGVPKAAVIDIEAVDASANSKHRVKHRAISLDEGQVTVKLLEEGLVLVLVKVTLEMGDDEKSVMERTQLISLK